MTFPRLRRGEIRAVAPCSRRRTMTIRFGHRPDESGFAARHGLERLEVGGGSVRIHRSYIQEKIFDLIGFSKEQKEQFSYF